MTDEKKLYDREHFQTQVEREALFSILVNRRDENRQIHCRQKSCMNRSGRRRRHNRRRRSCRVNDLFCCSSLALVRHKENTVCVCVCVCTSLLVDYLDIVKKKKRGRRRATMVNAQLKHAVTVVPCDLTHFFFRECMQIDDETVPCCIARHKSITGTFSICTVNYSVTLSLCYFLCISSALHLFSKKYALFHAPERGHKFPLMSSHSVFSLCLDGVKQRQEIAEKYEISRSILGDR